MATDSAAVKRQREGSETAEGDSAPLPGMDIAKNGWFTEVSTLWPGQGMSLKVTEVLYRGKSDFQDVCVFESEAYGTVLVLDGVIQATDRDEFSYQEMITHLPLCALKEVPKKVLVVGGGDGGVLRELTRYQSLQEIHIAEIDGLVVETAKKFFPEMAVGFADPRVHVHICDGIKYVEDAEADSFDAIIVDSSDPVGPAEVLFEKKFFEALHRAVKPGGIVCTQAESLWLHLDIIKALANMCRDIFVGGSVNYGFTTIPTYPSGQIGMMLCVKGTPHNPSIPQREPPVAAESSHLPDLKYYSSEMHTAAFALPKFAKDALKGALTFQ